jgi:hypothetical protein
VTAELLSITRPVTAIIRVDRDDWVLTLDDTDGRGLVSLTGWWGFAASYNWHADGRPSTPSLLRFLLDCDISYVAGKLRCDEQFDRDATIEYVRARLFECDGIDGIAKANLHALAGGISDAREWERWCDAAARAGMEEPWRIGTCTRIDPAFRRFYDAAWPLLRERRAEIEAVLYPQSAPTPANGVAT